MEYDLQKLTKSILESCHIYSGSILSKTQETNSKLISLHEALRKKNSWYKNNITNSEFSFFIIRDYVQGLLSFQDSKEYKALSEYKQFEDLEKVANTIVKVFNKIPLKYNFIFPTNITDENLLNFSCKVSQHFSITGSSNPSGVKSGSLLLQFLSLPQQYSVNSGNKLTVVGKVEGYVSQTYGTTETMEDIMTRLKIFFALCNIYDLFEQSFKNTQYTQLSCHFYHSDNSFINELALEHDISEKINLFKISDVAFRPWSLSLALGLPDNRPNLSKEEILKNNLTPVIKFFEYYDNAPKGGKKNLENKYFNKLQNGILWYLTSMSLNNLNMKLTSAITSLESIINEDGSYKRDSSTALAEACALNLSKNFQERSNIFNEIKRAYELRNRITHQGHLSQQEQSEVSDKIFTLHQCIKRLIKLELTKVK